MTRMTHRGWPGTGPVPAAEYDYPRRLTAGELAVAGAAGVMAGLAAFYVARVLAARTPLNEPPPRAPLPAPVPSRTARAAARAAARGPLGAAPPPGRRRG